MCLQTWEIYLDNDAYVDSFPEKDEEGNWKPILLSFNLNKLKGNGFMDIMTLFYNFDSRSNI